MGHLPERVGTTKYAERLERWGGSQNPARLGTVGNVPRPRQRPFIGTHGTEPHVIRTCLMEWVASTAFQPTRGFLPILGLNRNHARWDASRALGPRGRIRTAMIRRKSGSVGHVVNHGRAWRSIQVHTPRRLDVVRLDTAYGLVNIPTRNHASPCGTA